MSYRNKKIAKLLGVFVLSFSLLTGCGNINSIVNSAENATESSASNIENNLSNQKLDSTEMFTDRDKEVGYDEAEAVDIKLLDGKSSGDSSAVEIDGDVITIKEEGVYILEGSLSNGQIVVDAEGTKVQLVLNGVSVTNTSSAALYVKDADKVFVTTRESSENYLSTKEEFVAIDDNNIDAVVFSKDDITLNGKGTLVIETENGNGVTSKNDLKVTSGTYEISVSGHALEGKDSVRILEGDFTIKSGKDGIHSENADEADKGFVFVGGGEFNIEAEGDGIDASYILQVDGGSFEILAGGGSENASAHTSEFSGGNRGQFERRPDMTDKENSDESRPEMPEGAMSGKDKSGFNRPEMPEGGMPGTDWSDSNRPEMPEGEMPEGEMPGGDWSDSNRPEMPEGEMPEEEMPEGEMLEGDISEMADTDNSQESSEDTADEESTSTKGLKSDTVIYLDGGKLSINSADDSIHSNGSVYIEDGQLEMNSGDDGIHADEELVINSGTINVAESYEGLEGMCITINGGNIEITSDDDGLNAAGGNDQSGFGGRGGDSFGGNTEDYKLTINGGYLYVCAAGDGLDSNGDLEINGGDIYVDGPSDNGNAAIDFGDGASAYVNGGTLVAVGSSGMAESFDESSTQGFMLVKLDGTASAASEITLTDSKGNEVISYTASKAFDCVELSDKEIKKGETYTLTAGEYSTEIEMTDIIYSNSISMFSHK